MNTLRSLLAIAGIAAALGCGAAPSPAQSDDKVAREIARLESALVELEAADLPQDVRGLIPAHRDALARTKRATVREYQLYRLRDPFVGIETLSFVAREKAAGQSVERFAALWGSQRSRFEAKPQDARGSLLERALIESATSRAGRLFRASLPYAKASAPFSGVYYLGEAEGNLRFRDFVRSVATNGASENSPARARVATMLEELERTTVAFFGTDITNQALVSVSVRLKEARELLDAGRVDGAALMAMEARAALSRRGGPAATVSAEARREGSIAALLAAWAEDEEAPMRDALRRDVMPWNGALFLEAPQTGRARPAEVTVTLVRWPYT